MPPTPGVRDRRLFGTVRQPRGVRCAAARRLRRRRQAALRRAGRHRLRRGVAALGEESNSTRARPSACRSRPRRASVAARRCIGSSRSWSAECNFAEWTSDGIVRQASFVSLRSDKPARQIVKETPRQGADVQQQTDAIRRRAEATRREKTPQALANAGNLREKARRSHGRRKRRESATKTRNAATKPHTTAARKPRAIQLRHQPKSPACASRIPIA